jgi:uncharacterized membrane protein YbhN (UPF0104 family)
MQRLHQRPALALVLAVALALAAALVVATATGLTAFAGAWSHLHLGWLALVAAGEILAIPAYALAYETLAATENGPELARPLLLRVVMAGFGPHAVRGGFELDQRTLHAIDGDREQATVRVIGLGALEWALLAPVACASAIVLLVTRDHRAMGSVLWPWAIAVPVGFAAGLWLATPARRDRLCGKGRGWRRRLSLTLCGVGTLHRLAGDPRASWRAWTGMVAYWALDIAAFAGALRVIGLHPNLGETIVAYATGYALTRRSMPLGGAAVTEALMTFSLHWMGQPVGPALAAVLVYRTFNFLLPGAFALAARPRLQGLLAAADEGRRAAGHERRAAASPLAWLRLGRGAG